MTSIRDQILNELTTRLGTLTGWDAQLRGAVNASTSDAKVSAVVAFVTESKQIASTDKYTATMQVGVLVTVNHEDADATLDDGNPFRYLDRQVVLVEQLVHTPDLWGPSPPFSYVEVNGHEVNPPDEETTATAFVRLTFLYRHQFDDPEAG